MALAITSVFVRMPSGLPTPSPLTKAAPSDTPNCSAHVIRDDRLEIHNRVLKVPVGDQDTGVELVRRISSRP
jgi:hypothetical protein